MNYPAKTIRLRDGRTCTLRIPCAADADAMIAYLRTIVSETEYILWSPQEPFPTVEREIAYIESLVNSPQALCLLADVEGEVAGNCQISFNAKQKIAHRSSIAIALKRKFWGLGIGSALLRELLDEAERRGVRQTELDVVAENVRARALYEKMGFETVAVLPAAIRFTDGTLHDELHMIRINTKKEN